jgi:hypothetical protein
MLLKRDIGAHHDSMSTAPWKQALKPHHRPFDDSYIVAHAPNLLIMGYVHAMLLSRATFPITPLVSRI